MLEAKKRLEQAGIEVVGVTDHGFVQSIYFFDPNGIRLELTTETLAEGEADEFKASAHDATCGLEQGEGGESGKEWRRRPEPNLTFRMNLHQPFTVPPPLAVATLTMKDGARSGCAATARQARHGSC